MAKIFLKLLRKKLSVDDFIKQEIEKRLKRQMNELEMHIFSAMWSEHCGYLHSKNELKKFNRIGALFPDENAGGVKIGNWGVFFKTESHNHPCAVEPYQGAATGIGGIIRDILALNARPIALLNSLKFSFSQKHLIEGVTRGISDYGNSCGIADVGGEVIFDDNYCDLPLVNVMALGIAPINEVKLSAAKEDCAIVLLGSPTGLDGVGGAAFASKELNSNKSEEKIHVQIGDPFVKKKLIEATLEILKLEDVVACQDCGAAGLLSSTTEMAYKGKCSLELDLDKLHLAVNNMSAAQILLSETQERMVFALKKSAIKKVFEIAKKFELEISEIGKTFKGCDYVVKKDGKILSKTPLDVICNPYVYNLCPRKPKQEVYRECNGEMDIVKAVNKVVSNPEFASKKWFFEQWDYAVGGRTFIPPQKAGAAALKLFENDCFVGVCMDSKPRFCALDPYLGAKSTFLESYRNLVSSGFEPLGLTNCLNFANPQKDDVGADFIEAVDGLADISKEFSIPVVSGNVSFYNETGDSKIYPTVTIGMVGSCKCEKELIEAVFSSGESVFLLGAKITPDSFVGGSLYQKILFNFLGGRVDVSNYDFEIKLKNAIFELRKKELLQGAIDVSKGGVLGALLCVLFNSDIGFCGSLLGDGKYTNSQKLKMLFGEIEGRYIFSTNDFAVVQKYLEKNKIPFMHLGECVGDKIKFDGFEFELSELKNKYFNSISDVLDRV